MQLRFLLLVLLCGFGSMAAGRSAAAETDAGQNPQADISVVDEVRALASDSYHRREIARERLLGGGAASREALVAGLDSPDLEVRLASRELLIWLSETEQERQIANLLAGPGGVQEVELPGWQLFKSAAGESASDRALFARIVRAHAPSLVWLDQLHQSAARHPVDEMLAEMNVFLPIDITAISQGDPDQWGLLLLAASQPELCAAPVLSSRLRGALLNPKVNERLMSSAHQETLRRLITEWLEASSEWYINASMLKISLAYECGEIATQLAMRTLNSRQATPNSVVAAMTLLTRLEPQLARRELPRSIDDARVWYIVATRRGPIRSQVSDVALALLLYLDDHDPREVGYHHLEADPLTIFRDYSLGFDDEEHRRSAHERAERLLHLDSAGGDDVLAEDE